MVWGTMLAIIKAFLYILLSLSTLNESKHDDLLKEKLELHMVVHNCTIFMHDEAFCHKSRIAKQFWSENSSDLCPLENSLTLLKNKVSENHSASLAGWSNSVRRRLVSCCRMPQGGIYPRAVA